MAIPSTTPNTQPTKVMLRSSVKKYPNTKLLGHPVAFIRPKSLVRCAMNRKTMYETMIAPTAKIKPPTKNKNWEKTTEVPLVKVSWVIEDNPKPTWSPKISKKSVDATHAVRLTIVKPV